VHGGTDAYCCTERIDPYAVESGVEWLIDKNSANMVMILLSRQVVTLPILSRCYFL
jgi:hypothetical protein